MGFVIKHSYSCRWLAKPGMVSVYTGRLQHAWTFASRGEAERHAAPGGLEIVESLAEAFAS